MKNTDKEFYVNWTRKDLVEELCRVNAVLIGAAKDVEAVEKNLQEMKKLAKELCEPKKYN